jgi:predicted RNA-binding protein (virulence factor B family)
MDYFILEIGLGLMLIVVLSMIQAEKKFKERKERQKSQPNNIVDSFDEISQDQYERMLNDLFKAGIITQTEYNKLLVQGLPLFKE